MKRSSRTLLCNEKWRCAILHDDSVHWLYTFCSKGRIQICDNLKTSFSRLKRKCFHALYKNFVKEFIVSFLPVQNKFMGIIARDRNSLRNWNFRWKVSNAGTFWCENSARALDQLFGKQNFYAVPESLIPFKCTSSSPWEVLHKTGSVLQVFYRKQIQPVLQLLPKKIKIYIKGFITAKSKTFNSAKKWTSPKMFF